MARPVKPPQGQSTGSAERAGKGSPNIHDAAAVIKQRRNSVRSQLDQLDNDQTGRTSEIGDD